MRDNARAFDRPGVRYLPYLEPTPGAGRGLLEALAADAAVVVTDDFPASSCRGWWTRAAARLPVRLEAVDGNGLLPLRAADRAFPTALRDAPPPAAARSPRTSPPRPSREPFAGRVPGARPGAAGGRRTTRWPDVFTLARARRPARAAADRPATWRRPALRGGAGGGAGPARGVRRDAISAATSTAATTPARDVGSGLSPYLHFGHLSAHDVFTAVMRARGLARPCCRGAARGARDGWWGVSPAAEAFLDQLVTWRELGFNMCAHRPDYDQFASLPAWAQTRWRVTPATAREPSTPATSSTAAATHDPLWNAAQRQLAREGRIHNYLRMLWGKKILQWSPTPEDALATMIDLNNRYALDGRDPNSYSGIFWMLGRYDRPWGPERAVFGTVRYMSSENTARKLRVKDYLARYADPPSRCF